MRTDTQKKVEAAKSEGASANKETMKVVRKSLHPLQIAAGDKENLVGAGRMPSTTGEKDGKILSLNSKNSNSSPKKEKQKVNKVADKKIAIEHDLTSEEGPSEQYWELLAETRRKALEKALIENQQLHEKLQNLTEEKDKYKSLLDEAQMIIDTLNEIIGEMGNEDDSRNDEEEMSRRA
ncbi:geminin-like isoform X1 [Macrosteles quadrilineatus]|uniref:geminin-like isoform X1 n=2 Tax=Macrosteles quadrilineatus TaxID=74068 RepID=UPI0023E233AB|nr:geminin-like isoform X1 [Macrosteles quadrilineatus]XP_054290823.1 geminin-like isoform X1 [Macrosteles quadrilineatus]